MAKAWMPLYIGDYLGDTGHLSQGQHGAYLLLMMHYWSKNMLQASVEQCYKIARAYSEEEKENVRLVLADFFTLDDGNYVQSRINSELERVNSITESNKKRAQAGAAARWKDKENAPSIIQAMPDDAYSQSQSQSQSEPKKESKSSRFTPPTIEEVKAYCDERGNGIDAEYFVNSNTSKGWVVGELKTPMKDWKATIRTWEGNNKKRVATGRPGNLASRIGATVHSQEESRCYEY